MGASLLCETHFWTLKQQINIRPEDLSCFYYHDKKDKDDEILLHEVKKKYAEGRDTTWTVRNKRPGRLKENLKEFEELLASKLCLTLKWLSRRCLQICLSNGILVTCLVSPHTGDVDRIDVDKSLIGKLASDVACDMSVTVDNVIISFPDRPRLDYVCFTKKQSSDIGISFEKMKSRDPKVTSVEIPSPLGRKLHRRIARSSLQNLVMCWWSYGLKDVIVSAPMTGEKELASLVVLVADGPKLELVTYTKTVGDLVLASFSGLNRDQILAVEQTSTSAHSVDVYVSVYSIVGNKIRRTASTTIPVQADVLCADFTADEQRVVICCANAHVLVYDVQQKVTRTVKATVAPHLVRWHSSGVFFIVSSGIGEMQMFDLALSPIGFQPVEDRILQLDVMSLSSYMKSPSSLSHIAWIPAADKPELKLAEPCDLLSFIFEKGPFGAFVVNFGIASQGLLTPLHLVNQHIRGLHFNEAVSILKVLDWNLDGKTCFACLSSIANQLLKQPLNELIGEQLHETLGCFYNSVIPLSEITVLEYRDTINQLARRFFHHLLRYSQFEKAYLLAIDVGSSDLFMDLHYAAKDKGELALSQIAFEKSKQLNTNGLRTDYTPRQTKVRESLSCVGYDDALHTEDRRMFSAGRSRESVHNSDRDYCDASELVRERLQNALVAQFTDEFTKTFVQLQSDTDANDDGAGTIGAGVVHFRNV